MPFSEHDSVDHPVSMYAATKKANELMAHTYSHLFGLPTTGLRFFTVYGPWGRPDMALFLFTKAILEGRPIDVFNHGRMQRDFTYVDDIVEGVIRVLTVWPSRIPPTTPTAGPGHQQRTVPRLQHRQPRPGASCWTSSPASNRRWDARPRRTCCRCRMATCRPPTPTCRRCERLGRLHAGHAIRHGVGRFVDWYRGYYKGTNHLPLVATCKGQSVGTLTVSLDGPKGLGCEATFPEEVSALRESGKVLCEFTRLAVHPEAGSRQAIASLFQVAYLVATRLGEADAVMLEVNPRHVAYYQRIIGATVLAGERFHERAQAPAVLLSIACDDVRERINRGATEMPHLHARRSLYSLALSPVEENAILARIRQLVQTVRVDYPPVRFRVPASREPVVLAAC
jgi:hypothetical protein